MKARQYGPSISLRKVGWPSRGLFHCGGSRADPWLISPNGDFICSYGEVASVNEDERAERSEGQEPTMQLTRGVFEVSALASPR